MILGLRNESENVARVSPHWMASFFGDVVAQICPR
jgi:hypothetical protein